MFGRHYRERICYVYFMTVHRMRHNKCLYEMPNKLILNKSLVASERAKIRMMWCEQNVHLRKIWKDEGITFDFYWQTAVVNFITLVPRGRSFSSSQAWLGPHLEMTRYCFMSMYDTSTCFRLGTYPPQRCGL